MAGIRNIGAILEQKYGLSGRKADQIVATVFNEIEQIVLEDGGFFMVKGFGTFKRKASKAREMRLPNGSVVKVDAKVAIRFKCLAK